LEKGADVSAGRTKEAKESESKKLNNTLKVYAKVEKSIANKPPERIFQIKFRLR